MSLADRLGTVEPAPHHSAGCGVGRFWSSLDDEDRTWFENNVLWNETLSDPDRSRYMSGVVQIHQGTFSQHRRGTCQCAQRGWAQPDG